MSEDISRIKKATRVAKERQYEFYQSLRSRGKEVLRDLGEEKGFVIISRPYNGCDPGLNLEIYTIAPFT